MSEMKVIHNLVEFDCLLGIDVGTTMLFLKKYKYSDYIDPAAFHSSLNAYYNAVVWREDRNPLKQILKPDYQDSADDLYNEFFGRYENEIYLNSPITEVTKYMNVLLSDKDNLAACHINCHSNNQVELIRKLIPNAQIELGRYDLEGVSTLFLDDMEDLPNYQSLDGKYLFLMMNKRNINNNWLVKPLPVDTAMIIRVVQQYDGIIVPLDTKGVLVDEQTGDTIRIKNEHCSEVKFEKITVEELTRNRHSAQ